MIILNTETGRLEVEGSSVELAVEVAALVRGIYDGFINGNKEVSAADFKKRIEILLPTAFMPGEEIEKKTEEDKDIRSADFDSEDEFVKWFRGRDNEEDS